MNCEEETHLIVGSITPQRRRRLEEQQRKNIEEKFVAVLWAHHNTEFLFVFSSLVLVFFVRPFIHTRLFVRVSAAGFLISRVELYKRLRRRP